MSMLYPKINPNLMTANDNVPRIGVAPLIELDNSLLPTKNVYTGTYKGKRITGRATIEIIKI